MSSNVGLTPAPTGSTSTAAAPSGLAGGPTQPNSSPSGAASSGSDTNSGSNANPSAGSGTIPPTGDITITERFMSDSSWPPDLRLDLAKSNWEEWSFLLMIKTDRLGFLRWLKGTLPQPDATTHAKAHEIWETNNFSLRGFIFECISKADYNDISHLTMSHLIFNELCQRHEKLGPQAQLILLKKALDFRYDPNLPFCDGTDEIITVSTMSVVLVSAEGKGK
jgi:hypothetical protein